MHYVVSLGLDERSKRLLRPELRGAVRKFLPHISIKGRFALRNDSWHDLCSLVSAEFAGLPATRVHLSLPTAISPTLVWRELSRPDEVRVLRSLHLQLRDALVRSGLMVSDRTPIEFQNEGFRPHITTRWFCDHGSHRRPTYTGPKCELEVMCACLEIYHYVGLPFFAHVTRTELRKLA
jgi:hypothetical protein